MKEILLAFMTNAIVILGWYVVFKQAVYIKNRDDIRKNIDLITRTIDEIFDLCKMYYSSENAEHINYTSASIKAKFVLLSHYFILIKDTGIFDRVLPTLTEYKIHATGGYFETIDFHKQVEMQDWRSLLAASAHELKFRAERGYFDWSKRKSGLLFT
ncbi:MAG: hypothetical protein IPO97_00625 [Sphingomonadales bacterium]|nr:hypothetical protein [Sphingomonadales bacterium]